MSFNLRWGGAIEFGDDRWRGWYALDELCKEAKLNGITKVYDNIAIGNLAVRLFEKCGFKEEYRTDEFVMVGKEL